MKKYNFIDKSIWFLYFVFLSLMIYRILSTFLTKHDPHTIQPFLYASLLVPYLVVILHSYRVLGLRKTIIFQALAGLIGFFTEFIGINYGYIFGGIYSYSNIFLKIYNVPLVIFFMWGVFTYIGYIFTDSFFIWIGKKNQSGIFENILFILLNALIVTSMDLFLEPIEIYHKQWSWLEPGIFFGSPLGNFLGWVITVGLITLFFRAYEIFNPKRPKALGKNILSLGGVIAYTTFFLTHMIIGGLFGMRLLFLIGILPSIFILYNLWLYSKYKTVSAKNDF